MLRAAQSSKPSRLGSRVSQQYEFHLCRALGSHMLRTLQYRQHPSFQCQSFFTCVSHSRVSPTCISSLLYQLVLPILSLALKTQLPALSVVCTQTLDCEWTLDLYIGIGYCVFALMPRLWMWYFNWLVSYPHAGLYWKFNGGLFAGMFSAKDSEE